jgi:hypothetical protein
MLLVSYQDFFRLAPPTIAQFLGALPDVVAAKAGALVSNVVTALVVFFVLLGPLALLASWWLRARADVRAWSSLLVLIFLAQSLFFTLHSTRGSYFHSLAAFFPFGIALAAAGSERALATRSMIIGLIWGTGAFAVALMLSAGAIVQWDATFNDATRVRMAALDAIPAGPFMAIDAAAWRSLSGRPVIVTPAESASAVVRSAVVCEIALRYGARALVLEAAHFSGYDSIYNDDVRPSWLGPPTVLGTVQVFPIYADNGCPSEIIR